MLVFGEEALYVTNNRGGMAFALFFKLPSFPEELLVLNNFKLQQTNYCTVAILTSNEEK